MVGVAGRSKACTTCKQRKIRCSYEVPECRICVKSGRICGGYHRDRVFVLDARTAKDVQLNSKNTHNDEKDLFTISGPEIATRKEAILKSPDKVTFEESDSPPPFNFWQVTGPMIMKKSTKGSIQTTQAFSSLWSINCPSTRSCYRQQIISEYLYTYYKGTPDPNKAQTVTGNWLSMLPELPTFTSALEASMLAVSTARLGRVHNDIALVQESLKFHTQALWELQKALYSPTLRFREETVAACLALLMYEVGECPNKSVHGWMEHVKGCGKIVEMRGPRAYQSEFAHRLFITFRHLEITQALVERRSTFLAQPKWKEQPWKGFPKPVEHNLLDLIAEMANISAAGYRPKNPDNPALLITEFIRVVERCWVMETKLDAFYRHLEESQEGPLYWPVMADYNPLEDEPAFPVLYEFSSLGMAHTCTLYWATVAMLWSGFTKIYHIINHLTFVTQALGSGGIAEFHIQSLIPTPQPPSTPAANSNPGTPASPSSGNIPPQSPRISTAFSLPDLEHRTDLTGLATDICRALPYLQASLAKVGSHVTGSVIPLRVAIEVFSEAHGYEKQLAWALKNFQVMIGSGAKLLEHLDRKVTEKTYLPS